MTLLKWALICLLIAIAAAALGFTGVAAGATEIAKFLFYISLIIFAVILIFAVLTNRLGVQDSRSRSGRPHRIGGKRGI
jgi:uncharacterized membrane protein YtjA (UPF0391 family)